MLDELLNRALSLIIQSAAEPESKVQNQFIISMNESRFLFNPNVHQDLQKIWKDAIGYFALKSEMNNLYATQFHYGDGNPKKETDIFLVLCAYSDRLIDIFGDEMKLGDQDLLQAAHR